jgi:hypothetical protein
MQTKPIHYQQLKAERYFSKRKAERKLVGKQSTGLLGSVLGIS